MFMKRPGRLTDRGLHAPCAESKFPTITVPQAGDVADEFVGVLDGPGGVFQAFARFPALE